MVVCPGNPLVIDDGTNTLARIDSNTGEFFLKGNVYENNGNLNGYKTDSPEDFIVQNSGGTVKVVIDSNGNLRMTGEVLEYRRL